MTSSHIRVIRGLFRPMLNRIGPNSLKKKKKKEEEEVWPQMCVQPRPWPHDTFVRIRLGCPGPII